MGNKSFPSSAYKLEMGWVWSKQSVLQLIEHLLKKNY